MILIPYSIYTKYLFVIVSILLIKVDISIKLNKDISILSM